MKSLEPKKFLLIGASTGGPAEIEKIILAIPKLHNTTVIVAQHMLADFLPSFSARLAALSKNPLFLALNETKLEENSIYICSTSLRVDMAQKVFIYSQEHNYNPDINVLFDSFVGVGGKICAVILTGIGDDGVRAATKLSELGALVITQDCASAIVDGMPCRARESISNIIVCDTEAIVSQIVRFCESD